MARQMEIQWGRIREVLEAAIEPGILLERLGAFLASKFVERFSTQRIGADLMPARGVPNVAGILRYLETGRSNVPERYFQPRPVLIDTGRLRNSITFEVVAGDELHVGTSVPYAAKHIEGGEETIPGPGSNPILRSALARYLRSRPDRQRQLAYLFNRDEVTINIQPRNFLAITPDVENGAVAVIEDYLRRRIEQKGPMHGT